MHKFVRYGMLLILTAFVPALFAHAAPAKPTPAMPGVGVVDLGIVQEKYKGSEEAMAYFRSFRTARQSYIEELQKGEFLTADQCKELMNLVVKPVKSPRMTELQELSKKTGEELEALTTKMKAGLDEKERARLAELETQQTSQYGPAPEAEKEYRDLQAKATAKMSEADQKRMKELQANQDNAMEQISRMHQQYQQEIQAEGERLVQLLNDAMQKAVGDVAQKKGLSIVVNKTVETQQGVIQFVLWGGTDITDDVTTELNNTFKADLFKPKS